MKRAVILLLVVSAAALAQQSGGAWQTGSTPSSTSVFQRPQGPSYSDIYCSGFVAPEAVPKSAEIIGGWDTPQQTRYVTHNYVYLAGSDFHEGSVYAIVRGVEDANKYETYEGQRALLHRTGRMYADIGHVRVMRVEGNTAIAEVEFSCEPTLPGDTAIPFADRPMVKYRPASEFNRFASPNGKLTGQIVMAKEFDNQVASDSKVYLNVGSEQGVKPGDYFRVVRTYAAARKVEVDRMSYPGLSEEASKNNPGQVASAHVKQFPRISLGEMIVLSVTPRTATALVTMALSDMHIGDVVELEEPVAVGAGAAAAAPATSAAGKSEAASAPTISCYANPATVRTGETSTVACEASSPQNRPISFAFSADRGRLIPRYNTAVLDTQDAGAGPVLVMASATDDRDQSSSATTTVNVEPASFPSANKLSELEFKRNSAFVNNVSKAVLDDLALRLQQNPGSSAVLVGQAGRGESPGLASRRATNARDYLTKSKGVDGQRVQTRRGEQEQEGTEVWWVPAGASMLQ